MRKGLRVLIMFGVLAGALFANIGAASAADDPFLCPVVGDGVNVADANNGDNGVSTIDPPVGTSLLPGNNQAGDSADANAYNADGPGNPEAGPGDGNSEFSPIWPG